MATVQFRPGNEKLLFAKQLRKEMTPAEVILWEALRNRRCAGLKFRRQVPLGPFIADFLCREQRLVIELDGGVHNDQKDYDAQRSHFLIEHKYRVIRFPNQQILNDLSSVLNTIQKYIFQSNVPLSPWLRIRQKQTEDGVSP